MTATEPEARLRAQVGRGAAWAAASNVTMRFAGFAVTALLARLLSPDDFGIYAIALAVYYVVASLAEVGMAAAVAKSAHEPVEIAPTVATISICTSVLFGALMALGAGALAQLLGQPEATETLRVLAISLAMIGFFSVPGAQLVREFRQDRIFIATVTGFLVSNPLLVLLALNGGDATAFAWSRVAGQLATGAVYIASTSRHYWPGWNSSKVKGLLLFGLPLALANLVNWTLLNADYLILGRLLGAAEVGVYMIAFNVASWSTAILGSVLNTVVIPAFGRVVGNLPRLKAALVAAARLVALVALPIAAVSAALAPSLIETLFGTRWADAAPVLVVLSLYGALFTYTMLMGNVLVATGATRQLLAVQAVWVTALVPGMVLGVRLAGILGAAWAHVIVVSAVALPSYLLFVRRQLGGLPHGLGNALLRPVSASAVAAGIAWMANWVLGGSAVSFLVSGTLAMIVYLVVARAAFLDAIPELGRWLGRWGRRHVDVQRG